MTLNVFRKVSYASLFGFFSVFATNSFASKQLEESKTVVCPHDTFTQEQAEEDAIQYDEVLDKLKKLPPSVQKSLLHGLDLNIMTIMIFAQMGRDKAYLFNPEKPALSNFFMQNLKAELDLLSKCPDNDFAPRKTPNIASKKTEGAENVAQDAQDL